MRKILVSLAVLVAAGAAKSADLGYDYDSDYLRGSDYGAPPPPAWIGAACISAGMVATPPARSRSATP